MKTKSDFSMAMQRAKATDCKDEYEATEANVERQSLLLDLQKHTTRPTNQPKERSIRGRKAASQVAIDSSSLLSARVCVCVSNGR